jgi:hypothetical protein
VVAINTNEYRLTLSVLALRDGMRFGVSPRLRIAGCGSNDESGAMRAGVGAIFRVDAATDVVASVGCNGCM